MDVEHLRTTIDRLTAAVSERTKPDDLGPMRQLHAFLYGQVLGILRDAGPADGTAIWGILETCADLAKHSKSQLFQDLWVLYELGRKREGFFVEFGATNGVDLSNTWLLEKHFGWTGVLAEPNPDFHDALKANRSCQISFDCVYKTTGETVPFHCTKLGEFSRIGEVTPDDGHEQRKRQVFREVPVATVTLNDLLKRHGAPRVIDYLSVDTEGSELDILSAFDFDAWDVRLISVEHNKTPARAMLYALLTRHGYERKFTEISRYDDWYARTS